MLWNINKYRCTETRTTSESLNSLDEFLSSCCFLNIFGADTDMGISMSKDISISLLRATDFVGNLETNSSDLLTTSESPFCSLSSFLNSSFSLLAMARCSSKSSLKKV